MTNDKLERVARAWRDSIAENAMVGSSIADLLNDTETLRLAAIAACEAGEREREIVLALEKQMENEEVQNLPSSLCRERGLVWLEGWFDFHAALNTTAGEAK